MRLPTIGEIRWLSQHRRERREAVAAALVPEPIVPEPEPIVPAPEPIVPAPEPVEPMPEPIVPMPEPVEPVPIDPLAAVPVEPEPEPKPQPTSEPVQEHREWSVEALIEPTEDLDESDTELGIDLDFHPVPAVMRDWYFQPPREGSTEVAAAEPVEETPDEPDGDAAPPLVSHILVVREPAPFTPSRVAVLDEPATTVTRLVPLPTEAGDDIGVPAALETTPVLDPHPDQMYEPQPAVPKEWEGRPAPLYWRVLRLRYVRPNVWLRALFFEGSVAVAVVLVLAEAASVGTSVVLPIVVALIVKANDVLAGSLRRDFGPNDGTSPPSKG